MLLAALVTLAGCSTAASPAAEGPGEQAAAPPTSDPADLAPDPLPDPGVAPGRCDIVTYTPPTAQELQRAELCRPASAQRDVAVVVVHGGSGIGGSRQGMRSWADRLVAEGYVVLVPDYHLFAPGGESPVFPLPEQNLKASVQYLRGTAKALGISRGNIVVQGMSAGARLGAVAYTTPDDPWFDGAELWPDISTEVNGFIGFYHTYDGSMQFSSQYYGGPDDSSDAEVRDRWDHADALANAGDVRGPALFVTGSTDWDLIVEHQDAFAARVRRTGHGARTVVITGGGHGFDSGTATRLSRLGEQAAGEVLRWLNDEFPQDPRRAAQEADVDVATAPDRSGQPAVTYDTRRRPSTPRTTTTTGTRTPSPPTTRPTPSSTTTTSPVPSTTSTDLPPSTSASTTTTADPEPSAG